MAIIVSDTGPRPRKAGGGGKLNRSETVTVRLDPKLNYLCELGARAQRRTKSSFIEWAIEKALESVGVPGTSKGTFPNVEMKTIADLAPSLWDVDEADRLVALAENAPFLMTHGEQLMWKVITSSGVFWRGYYDQDGDWIYSVRPGDVMVGAVRQYWETIKRIADGDESAVIPQVEPMPASSPRPSPAFDADLDEECPF